MSGQPYIDGSTLDECREALRQGKKLEALAGILRCEPDHLARLLGIQATSQPAAAKTDQSCDLWAADRLDGQL